MHAYVLVNTISNYACMCSLSIQYLIMRAYVLAYQSSLQIRHRFQALNVLLTEIIYKGIGNEPTFHALERAIRTCTRTHNQQMYACTQIGQLSL